MNAERIYHEFSLPSGGNGQKESVTFTFETTWRGKPATVEMCASRHQYGNYFDHEIGARTPWTWGEWFICSAGAYGPPTSLYEGHTPARGNPLTDTARSRLSDQLRPDVEAWLASPEYGPSRMQAVKGALLRRANDLRPFGPGATRQFRQDVHDLTAEMLADDVAHLLSVADAFDAFVDTLGR